MMSSNLFLVFPKSGRYWDAWSGPNSNRGSPLVWRAMGERFWKLAGIKGEHRPYTLGEGPHQFWMQKDDDLGRLWKLADNPEVPDWARHVLRWTFDRVIVRRENAPRLANSIEIFCAEMPLEFGAGHLVAWHHLLRAFYFMADLDAAGFGMISTTVASDQWEINDPEMKDAEDPDDKHRPFNLGTDENKGEHAWLFEADEKHQKEATPAQS